MEKFISSQPPKDNSDNQDKDVLQSILSDSDADPSPGQQRESRKPKSKDDPWWKMVLECFVGAAVVTYTVVAGWQLKTMNETYSKIAEQTGYFQSQTKLMSQQMEGYMAAVVKIRISYDPSTGGNGLFGQLINTGRVISPTVVVDLGIFKHSYPIPPLTPEFRHYREEVTQLPVTQPRDDGAAPFDAGYMVNIDRTLAESMPLVVNGTIAFNTGFNDHIVTEKVCWAYPNLPAYKMKDGTMYTNPSDPVPCNVYQRTVAGYWDFRKAHEFPN